MRNVGKGRGVANVLLVGLDNEDMGLVREVLSAEAVLPQASVSFGDAVGAMKRAKPDVVIIGYNQAKDASLQLAQLIQKEEPDVVLLALSRKSEASEILGAVRAGFKDVVVLPDDANRLRTAVHDAAYKVGDDEEKGLVVAVVGAKGGVGCTLICTHLAAELAAIHRVLVMDLDFSVGDVASMLDVQPKDTIMDLLGRTERMDERMLTGSVAVHRSKVHVLGQPAELDRIEDVKADDVYAVINAAAKAYQYIILDCGVRWDEAALLALSVADLVVMVTTPDVIGVRDAYRRLKLFESNHVEKDRIRLVVNRYSKTAFVKTEDIEGNLGTKVVATIANDSATVDQAINEGKLVRVVNKKSDAARDLSRLVALLTDTDGGDGGGGGETEPESKGFFASLFGRG